MPKQMFSRTLVAAVAAVLAPAALAVEVSGQVADASTGQPIVGAQVIVQGTGRTVVTDRTGTFRIGSVADGAVSLRVRSVGYADAEVDLGTASGGALATDVRLQALAGSEIVVTGFRLAQMSALQAKKSAITVKDAITSDDAGKLPDQNAAEALQRVAGVSISIDQGEGRYVTVRGIDAGLNNVTIDGQTIGAPEAGSRRIALDTIPTELLGRLEVIKTVTPDMDGNAIGGTVNLVTPSAFDHAAQQQVTAAADVGYYDLNSESPFGGSLAYSRRFGADEQFGLVLSGSYSTRTYASENIQGGAEWEDENGFLIPDEFVLRDYELERIRSGIVANLEYRPNDQVKLYWRNLWNEFQDTEERQEAVIDYRNGDLLGQTATSGTFTEAEASRQVKYRREKQSILNTTLGGEYYFGPYMLAGSVGYGEAEQDTPFDNEWSFETADVFPASYDTSNFFWNVDGGAPFQDDTGYEFNEVARSGQIVTEELVSAQLDLRREIYVGDAPGYWKVGAKFTGRDKESDASGTIYDGYDGDLTLDQVSKPGRASFLDSVRPYYPFGPRVDYRAAEAVFASDTALFEVSDGDSLEESLASDYEVSEDITAAYLMAGVDLDRWSIVGGVRVERTEAEYGAFDLVFEDGDLLPDSPFRRGDNEYTNYLPGLQARFAPREDIVVRAAWTNTIGRAAYESLVPLREFEIDPDGNGGFEGSVAEGNPDLDPLESMNFDLSFEWYLRPAGLVSVGIFYKDIDNPIYTQVTEIEDDFYEGRFFSELSIARPTNAESGEILGVELNLQQQFTALPSPFDGFGVSLNYTWTDSEATVFGRDDDLPFFLQPDNIGNVALYYEKSGFEARLALAYRSEYLDEVADDATQDLYIDGRTQLDFKMSYAFAGGWKAYVEFLNLTDEPLRILNGNRRLAENEIYSWNAVAGVQVQF